MSQLTGNGLAYRANGPLYAAHIDPWKQPHKLGFMLTGQVSASGMMAGERFLDYAKSQGMDLRYCFGASEDPEGERLVSMGLIVPCQGRAGMFFLNPLKNNSHANDAAGLVMHIVDQVDARELNLLQALLEPRQTLEARAFELAGFSSLAKLLYMQRRSRKGDEAYDFDFEQDFTVEHYHEGNRELFERGILASYENTQDCPGLVGLRTIEDIVAGHRATGEFDPNLWTVVHQEGDVVGVVLLSRVRDQDALELVYLGVSDKWRGFRVGRKLVLSAIGRCAREQMGHLILAVDENNSPAIDLYRGCDFLPSVRKCALIKALKAGV